MSDAPRDLSHLLKPVALRLCGEPNANSSPGFLRFGANANLWVDLDAKKWGDDEEGIENGDVFSLIEYRTGLVNGGAEEWIKNNGFDLEAPPASAALVTSEIEFQPDNNRDKTPAENPLVSVELEQAFLGSALMDGPAVAGLNAVLPEHFAEPVHRRLWSTMQEISVAGRIPSPVTVAPYLPDVKIGEMTFQAYVATLAANAVGSPAEMAKGLVELGTLRQLETIGQDVIDAARARDAGEQSKAQIEKAMVALTRLSSQGLRPTMRWSTVGTAADELVNDTENPKPASLPVKSGLAQLDNYYGGHRPGALVIVAGRPGMGKSIIAGNFCTLTATQGYGVILFTKEMTKQQYTARLICERVYRSSDPLLYEDILNGRVTRDDWRALMREGARQLRDLPIIIDPQPGMTIGEISVRAARYIEGFAKRGIRTALVIVDHLGKVKRPGRQNDNVELGQVTAAGAQTAKELDTCWMFLAQLNRGVESRDDKRPTLGDLRESGHIEEDADAVLLLYRESYYLERKPKLEDTEKQMAADQKKLTAFFELDVDVGKNRHGKIGRAALWTHPGAAIVRDREQRDYGGNA